MGQKPRLMLEHDAVGGRWSWSLVAPNGKVMLDSPIGYSRRDSAAKAASKASLMLDEALRMGFVETRA